MPQEHEIIDVDEYEPEIEYIGAINKTGHSHFRKRPAEAEAPQDWKRAKKRAIVNSGKVREFIDLCESDKEKKPFFGERIKQSPGKVLVDEGACEADSDDEYANFIAALDIRDSNNWDPLPKCETQATLISLPDDSEGTLIPQSKHKRKTFLVSNVTHLTSHLRPHHSESSGPYIWQMAQSLVLKSQLRQNLRQSHVDQAYNALKIVDRFRNAAGCINKIAQAPGFIVIGSAASAGGPDYDLNADETISPYNTTNALMIWHDHDHHRLPGHIRERLRDGDPVFKQYTVNDVKVDPTLPTRFLSSGNDFTVQLWSTDTAEYEDDEAAENNSRPVANLQNTIVFRDAPQDIMYKPRDSAVAVTCRNGQVYIFPSLKSTTRAASTSFGVAPLELIDDHAAGALTWGLGSTSQFVFSSSEPRNTNLQQGFHSAFDLEKQKVVYKFSAREAGDAITVNSSGDQLALFTRGADDAHPLRLYDIRRKSGHMARKITLEPFALRGGDADGEVNAACFSPDSIYLAVARNDNVTHVYDSRNFEKGVLYRFKHAQPNEGVPGSDSYGIVEARWVVSRRGTGLRLVTGGNDGCVRLWNPLTAPEDPSSCKILAQADFDVGFFSLGDPTNGEKALVVGDMGGAVYVVDGGVTWDWTSL